MISFPLEIKHIQPFLQRSKELANRDAVMSYYCKYYAVQLGIQVEKKSKEASTILLEVMGELEELKNSLVNTQEISNDMIAHAYVENFALNTFQRAELAVKTDKTVATTFLAASLFLQVLAVFGDLDQETTEKIKYARFKAAEIMKALKEGSIATGGNTVVEGEIQKGTTDQNALGNHETTNLAINQVASFALDRNSIPNNSCQNTDQDVLQTPPRNITNDIIPENAHLVIPSQEIVNPIQPNYRSITDAQKHAKFAISALQFDDVKSAVVNLEKALQLLQPFIEK